MFACGKENQEGTFPAIWPVNPLCIFCAKYLCFLIIEIPCPKRPSYKIVELVSRNHACICTANHDCTFQFLLPQTHMLVPKKCILASPYNYTSMYSINAYTHALTIARINSDLGTVKLPETRVSEVQIGMPFRQSCQQLRIFRMRKTEVAC